MKRTLVVCAVGLSAALATVGAGCSDSGTGGSGGSGASGGSGGTGGASFAFATDSASAFQRVDRMGMPAINTAVIGRPADPTDSTKDTYNAENPTDDVQLRHGADIIANLTAFHTALDGTLTTLGAHPCSMTTMVNGLPACVAQAAPFVVPDTLKIDSSKPAGFPNGRKLTDPVIDVTLAVVLLDLSQDSPTTFTMIPLNPPNNDAAFSTTFPFLADPHTP